ncbi:uncharacterized protein LOC107475976 [Arachis duranensis]|uniref:Uncharacterized protein LOC107475976 n=1 Tax=Arachis duranensis TaxID=130453 RepID=A0A6P4CHS7_ARADU|nr:uncharacterized protein LOC107475976 [Arachis duranensis]
MGTINFQAKPISQNLIFLTTLILIFLSTTSLSSNNEENTTTLTAYDVLQKFNFPIGLLPNGVLSYELDPSTGNFKAYLDGTCTFKIESYDLNYKSTITGVITKNKISNLSGIQVKVLFLWLNIVSVTRVDDELQFSVGIASADFAVSNFYESPTCGCGFDCVNLANKVIHHGNMSSHDYVMSS